MSLDSIVDVSISANTASPSQAGFGVPGLISYFPTSVFPERSRVYSSLVGMTDDGHLPSDPAYLMAVALKAQKVSPKTWKVLRKALPSVQTVDLTPTITTAGEVLRVTVNGTEVSYTILAAATVATIVTAMTALLNAITGVTCTDNTTHMTLTAKNVASATLTVDGVSNTTAYTVTLDGTAFTYTSDASATATEIRDGLQALIIAGGYTAAEVTDNATDALDFAFASHAGADLRESAGGAGTMVLSSEVTANRLLTIGGASTGVTVKDNTPDPGIATDFAAIIAEDLAFYEVGLDSESEAQTLALAALVETQKMIYVPHTIDSEVAVAATTTDVGSDLKAAGYARTALINANHSGQYGGLRWGGLMLPKDPGSASWAYKSPAGFTVSTLTAAQVAALDGKNVNHYTVEGGLSVTRKGYSASGEFLDVTRGSDWFQARLQERIFGLLVSNDKVPFNVAGDLFRAEILAQLEEGRKRNVIAPDTEDTPWVITVPEVVDISAANKALRNFPGLEFSAFLANAVHTVQITGNLSL